MRVIEINREGQPQRIVTYLEPADVERLNGIPPQAVIGLLGAGDALRVNSLFREFLQETIAVTAPLDPDMQAAAQARGDGRLVYIDSRVPEERDTVPVEDILGWFQVRAGQIVEDSYLPNPDHKIEGAYGITAALGGMRRAMVDRLMAIQTP